MEEQLIAIKLNARTERQTWKWVEEIEFVEAEKDLDRPSSHLTTPVMPSELEVP